MVHEKCFIYKTGSIYIASLGLRTYRTSAILSNGFMISTDVHLKKNIGCVKHEDLLEQLVVIDLFAV